MSSYANRMMRAIESSGPSTSSNKTSATYAEAPRHKVISQTSRQAIRLEADRLPAASACADGAPWTASLVQYSSLVINKDPLCLIIVMRARDCDLRRGEVELSRAQLDDVSQPKIITGLGEVERQAGLLEQLLCQGHSIICRGGVQPGNAHGPDDAVLQVVHVLSCGLSLQLGLRLPGLEQATVEDRDRDVHSDRAVTRSEERRV